MKEKAFENKIKDLIESNGGWQVKFFANGFTKKGIPDLLCCLNGVFMGIEVKGDGGRPSDLQLYHLKKIREAGGIGIVVYPEDFESLKDMVFRILMTGSRSMGRVVKEWNERFQT